MLGEGSSHKALPGDDLCLRWQKLTSLCGVQEALLPGQALHRRVSSLDSSMAAGDPAGLLPHTALRRCLDAWAPLLIDECDFAAAFLLLYKPIDEAQGARPGALRLPRRCTSLPCSAHGRPKCICIRTQHLPRRSCARRAAMSAALQFSPPLMCLTSESETCSSQGLHAACRSAEALDGHVPGRAAPRLHRQRL